MSDNYAPPNAKLLINERVNLTFLSLGIWRKIYLILNWVSILLIVILMNIGMVVGQSADKAVTPLYMVSTVLIIFAVWAHSAIVGRRVTQLRVLCFIQIIPFMNPLGAIIFWAISSTSKTEIKEPQEVM